MLQNQPLYCQNTTMAEKPKPVPWGDVDDLIDDLTQWLIKDLKMDPARAGKLP
jgi:hypothetical protein